MQDGVENLVDEIDLLHTDLKFIMTALGVKTIEELQSVPLVVKGETYHWLAQRGLTLDIIVGDKKSTIRLIFLRFIFVK